jgi:hypothetical protein
MCGIRKKSLCGLVVLALITPLALASRPQARAQDSDTMRHGLVNLDHLLFLTEPVSFDGRDVALVHIYSEHPEYEWVDASGEGIAAVDDVARAALVYLWYYDQTGDARALEQARLCLHFVRYLQNDDGTFYNFVTDRDGTINTQGNTSYKSLGWWAMRSLWALAEGYRVFGAVDPDYAAELQAAYRLTEAALAGTFQHYGEYNQLHGFSIPAWIPGGAADVSSVALLALVAYYRSDPNPDTQAMIEHIADGLAAYQLGDSATYPFGMHPVTTNAPGYWHAWGSRHVHALAEAGDALARADWIASATADADTFLMRQLAFGRFREIGVLPYEREQIAYGTNVIVQGYMALYRATGEERYAQLAGLAASWFFGNNMAGVPMYDPATGRCFDGINGPVSWRVNHNAGAESTIEALMAMLAVHQDRIASKYLDYTEIDVRPAIIAETEWGYKVAGKPNFRNGTWTGEAYYSNGRYYMLKGDDVLGIDFDVPVAGDYWLYVAHQRQDIASEETTLVATRAPQPITVDGVLDEWADVPVFEANTPRNILRGAALWRGPDVDSFALQLMWDVDNLYLAATVRDPVFEQLEVGPATWRYDSLWVYLDGTRQKIRLSTKLNLTETPHGPQIWDWIAGTFLPNGELAWQPFDTGDGYIYEATLPFRSLRIRDIHAGKVMGIEAGRGLGGDSFIDLTGSDPDTAANLARLILVNELSDLDEMGGAETVLSSADTAIAVGVSLDGGPRVVVPANTAPDRRYLWLDRVGDGPVTLGAGEHTLHVSYAGSEDKQLVVVDGFLIQPVVARRVLEGPDGSTLTLTYDTAASRVTIVEK